MNQYLNNNLNGHSIQFLKPSVQNIEENVTSRAAIFRLQRDESLASFSTGCDVTFCWLILTQKFGESLAPPPDPDQKKICKSSSSLFDEIICNEIFDGKKNSKSKIFGFVRSRIKKKKTSRVQTKFKSRMREEADQ